VKPFQNALFKSEPLTITFKSAIFHTIYLTLIFSSPHQILTPKATGIFSIPFNTLSPLPRKEPGTKQILMNLILG
jgi:hypothetical protein